MRDGLTAHDLWPLVLKLPHDEQIRLAKLALRAAAVDDTAAYRTHPPSADEFGAEDDPLSWDAQGWE